jgi:hypothetical protein
MGESSKAAGLIPGGMLSLGERPRAASEAKGIAVRNRADLTIPCALKPHLAALLSAMLMLGSKEEEDDEHEERAKALRSSSSIAERG